MLVFATAGVLVIGLGVILLFAYNWDGIPKLGKLALVLLALIGAHASAIHLLARSGWQPKTRDVHPLSANTGCSDARNAAVNTAAGQGRRRAEILQGMME